MAFRMRSSKFRHVFGSPARKELCYECVRITRNAHDASFCAVNPRFIAIITESAGGGSFLVLPLEKTGRVDINAPKVCGHSGPVLDIKWNPFNDQVIASCSDDATIKLWEIPEGGLKTNLTEWLVDLHGHQKRVSYIEWHPTARDILLSAGYDFKCILWNTETAEPINIISVHVDTIFSISWNHDGSLFATTSKDKKIRVIDPREGNVVAEGMGHGGSKASKLAFLGDRNKLFTTGFSRMSERQLAVWEARNLSKPLKMDTIDASSGVLCPFYDIDTGVVFVAGKGDGNIRYYEITDEAPYVHYLSQYQSSNPQRGLGILPKRGVDPSKCEIVRFYKLHATKGLCEPVSMIVPRKSEMFQDDIFPPTASATPSLTADEWISGQNREPILISLKDGVISNSPTITTYKAVKRGTSSIIPNTSIDGLDQRTKRQATTPPHMPPVSSVKLPASIKNIQKLSSMDDPLGNHIKEGKENVNELLNNFEKRTNVVSKSSTRLTNANEPMRVDQKTWSATYNSNAAYNNANGMPRTDPEPVVDTQKMFPRRTSLRRTASENTRDSNARRINLKINSPQSEAGQGSGSHSVQMRQKSRNSRNSLTDGLLSPEDKRASTNRWSWRSSVNDEFLTPPSTPSAFTVSSNQTLSPSVSEVTSDSNSELLTSPKWNPPTASPKDWKVNPIYDVSDKRLTDSSEPKKPSEIKRDNLSRQGAQQTVVSKTSELDSNHNYDENYFDLQAFPDDAPDDTLVKPSELRESMKKRYKGGRPGVVRSETKTTGDAKTSGDTKISGDTNNNITKDRSIGAVESEKTYYEQRTAEVSEPVDFLPEANENAIKVLAFRPNKPASPYDNVSFDTSAENGYLHQAMVDDYPPDNTLLTPSKLRESMRRKKLDRSNVAERSKTPDRSNTADPQREEEASRIHVKKVWSPEVKPTNLDIANDNQASPKTDPELRKAYFRQLEEIKSLREQIMVKDKRINQLEEEVKHMREQRDMEESTC